MEPYNPESELQRFYHRLLRPLSLFPREATIPESQKRLPEEVPLLLPLPVSRLTGPFLCRLVARRLASSGLTLRVPPECRLRFTKVILDELKCGWKEPPSEPNLSHLNHQRLRKRLQAHVLLCSEHLFLRYLYRLVTMSTPTAVFTESATLTRLAAKLARDCVLYLTSPDVYRSLLADFLTLLKTEQAQGGVQKLRPVGPSGALKFCPIPLPRSTCCTHVTTSSLSLNYLIRLSRPPEFFWEPESDPVKELKSIPQLKKRRPVRWLPAMQKKRESDSSSSQTVPLPSYSVPSPSGAHLTSHLPGASRLQRGLSMPTLRVGWKLADELGLPPLPTRPLTPLVLVTESKPELAGDLVAKDLKQMNMKLEWTSSSSLNSSLSPILAALTRRPAAAGRMEKLQRILKDLEKEEDSEQRGLRSPKPPPLPAQPMTVQLKLRDRIVLQVAAVQVSERNFLDSFHVEEAKVLYNHLNEEVEFKLLKEMDMERLVGSTIREVYKALLSHVSNKHFSFDQGPLIEPAADKDWSPFLFSAFAREEKQHCIINPQLAEQSSPRAITLQSNADNVPSFVSAQPTKIWGKQFKTSWLNWWKATVSADDYFKYLANQETDFLHVIFQMFEEEVPVEILAPFKESLKIQHPPPLLEDEEPDFVPGEWGWKTMLECTLGTKSIKLLGESHKLPNLQKRLERLWSVLEVPDKDRLDMAIKYSSNTRLRQLPSLVNAWEQALHPIQVREILLGRLEWFERQASDPNRFFQKTAINLNHFLEESHIRNCLHKKLSLVEGPLVSLLKEIESVFGEPVTFMGRRYLDKMKRDKVEMLYWLQQQRRFRHLVRAQKVSHQPGLYRRLSNPPLVAPGNSPTTF